MFSPMMFMVQEPQIPARQERRNTRRRQHLAGAVALAAPPVNALPRLENGMYGPGRPSPGRLVSTRV